MFLFGVTGGVGCGKSVVCNFLKEKGLPVIEADQLAKDLTHTLPEIRQALTREFGKDVFHENGQLNKQKLSQLVFSDVKTRHRVNQIIHPHVLQYIQTEAHRLEAEEGQSLIGVEAALIYESGMDRMLDAVVVVTAPVENRIRWIQERNQWSQTEILKRIHSQMPDAEKVRRADYLARNEGSLEHLKQTVDALYDWLQARKQLKP